MFPAATRSQALLVTPAPKNSRAGDRFQSFAWLVRGPLAGERYDRAIARREQPAGYGRDLLRRDPLVQRKKLIDCFRRSAEPDVRRERIGNCRRTVHAKGETVSNAGSRGIELRLIDGLLAEALKGSKDLCADVIDVFRVFDASINRKQLRIRMIAKVGLQFVHLLFFQHEPLIKIRVGSKCDRRKQIECSLVDFVVRISWASEG